MRVRQCRVIREDANMRVLRNGAVCLFLIIVFCAGSTQAAYKIKVPHEYTFVCEEGTGGYTGYWGVHINWAPYPDCSGYQIVSHHGAFGGGNVGGDVTSWAIMGGSPVAPGGCAIIESGLDRMFFQRNYEVWATFNEGGTLELHKTSNACGAVRPGDEIRYVLIYKNTGRYTLSDCIVTESWPSYMEYVAGGNPTGGNSVTWNFGSLPAGHWRQVELVLRISENLPSSITEIYNVAVVHPAPSVTPLPGATPPSITSSPHGAGVSFCDALRCNVVDGEADWIDRPGSSTFESLVPYDVVRGNDEVRLVDGYTSFNHTIPTGVLLLIDGGFRLTDCSDLPDNVFSEITLDVPSSIEHSVSGIMNPDEYVMVLSRFFTVQIHNGKYTLTGETDRETIEVQSGHVTVLDPNGNKMNLGAGATFTWPPIIGKPDNGDGPVIVECDPPDFGSVRFTDVIITYLFDQPVTSIGEMSRFSLGETHGAWQGTGRLDELSAQGKISVTWNGDGDQMTIGIPGTYPWTGHDLHCGQTLVANLHLVDVEGASGVRDNIYESLTLFCTTQTDSGGCVNCEFAHFGFITTENGLLSPYSEWNIRQLHQPPGPFPDGFYQAGPVFEFEFLGTVNEHYYLTLRPCLRWSLPLQSQSCSIFRWSGSDWEQSVSGFDLYRCWTEALTDPHQILVLLTNLKRPEVPEILSIQPDITSGPVDKDTPIVIQVSSISGIRQDLAGIRINSERTLGYDPMTGEVTGWTMEEENGLTTFTYTPAESWPEGLLVYGSYYLPARYGLAAAEGDFAFQVDWTDMTDSDSDGMPDSWEDANGTEKNVNDRNEDPDGDQFSNWTEFQYRSHPMSSASLPAFPQIDLYSNQQAFFDNDRMTFTARITNGPIPLPVDLYVVVEILGGFYFWPEFSTAPIPLNFTMPENIDVSVELLSYTWEEIPAAMDLTWYRAFVDPDSMFLYSLDMMTVKLKQ